MTAIAALMAHTVIPHHEHGETICFEKFDCSSDADETAKESHACCLDQQEIIRSQDDEHHYDCAYGTDCKVHFPAVLLFIGNFFALADKPVRIDNPYQNLYTSADIVSANTLRGPPQV